MKSCCIELIDKKKEKLEKLAASFGVDAPMLLTIFAEDLLDGHELLEQWSHETFKKPDGAATEALRELYHKWSLTQSSIDSICDAMEEQLPEKTWKAVEVEFLSSLSRLQEKSFWAGAKEVSELQKRLKNLPDIAELTR